jgi:SAM-dependent methyltransferase
MPDAIFAEPRLASIYDATHEERPDLEVYAAMVTEFGAQHVLDVGCGTGVLACILASRGVEVTGIDPALASLDVARTKPHAEKVRWIHGGAADAPPLAADLAVMTGNVAQVFLDDIEWLEGLRVMHRAIRPGGLLVFEVRDPARRAWEMWTPDRTRQLLEVPGEGSVETWVELTGVSLPFVSFRHVYVFESDGARLVSESTLRFRERPEIESSLAQAGFEIREVRDAPDRPGLEWVFVAERVAI